MRSKHYVAVALIMGLSIAMAARAETVEDRLQKGVYQEETVGDLEAAIKIYGQIVADEKANRPHVAQARFRLGMCFLKRGQKQQAIETFERLIKDYPGQPKLIEQAQKRLMTLGHAPKTDVSDVQLQDVWAYSGLGELDVLAISRDGQYCGFADDITGEMMVRDLKTESDQRLAEKAPKGGENANWQRVSISPDNKWVAYVGPVSNPKSRSCLRIVAIDGSDDRVLHANEEKSVIRDLGWSPDSQQVLATFHDTRGERDVLDDVSVRIATVSLADGSMKLLKTLTPEESHGPGPKPEFSPNGRYVAYSRMMNETSRQEDIFLIPTDGGPETHLIENPADDDVLGWMPDSRGLLFRSDRGGDSRDAWLVRIANGKPAGASQLIQAGIGPDLEGPVRTPTGGWAFYYANVLSSRKRDVFIAQFDPEKGQIMGEPKPASERFPGDNYRISGWSPDGKFLAYHAESRTPQWPQDPRFLVIRTTQTGRERAIKLGKNRIPGPVVWSPDGRSILLSSEWGRFGPLHRLDVESGAITPIGPLTDDGEYGTSQHPIGWSADGKSVFAFRNRYERGEGYTNGQILLHNLETGKETQLHREKNSGIFACDLSPDRSQIAYAFPVGNKRSLMVMPTAGGKPRELFSVPDPERILDAVTWSLDGRYLLFWKVRRGDGLPTYELWRIPTEGGQAEKLTWESEIKILGLRLHPNGKQVAFSMNRGVTKNQVGMMQISPQWAKESCIANLKTIAEAVKRYEHDHGGTPDQLSDLYPDYLQDPSLVLCPAHDERKNEAVRNDSEMQTSYRYVRGGIPRYAYLANFQLPVIVPDEEMTKSEVLKLRLKYFGEISGLLECSHHNPDLQLVYDGAVHEDESWRGNGRAAKGLLSQLHAAMESNPDTWIEDYDIPKFASLLEDRTTLSEVLRSYIKAHPSDANASAEEALAELRRIRFISRPEDDAEETHDGRMELHSSYCLLGGFEGQSNRAMGLRFTNIRVPQDARIKRAYVQFNSSGYTPSAKNEGLIFHGELDPNAASFQGNKNNITSRRKTVASVKCSPKIWDFRSLKCRTSDLAPVIQEITAQPDWQQGNALVLIVSGSSQGDPTPWDRNRGKGSAMLYIEVE